MRHTASIAVMLGFVCAAAFTHADTYVRTAVKAPLTNGAAWDLGTVPGGSDMVVWTNSSATGNTTNGGSSSWLGVVFNATANVTIVNGTGALTTNTLGSAGVDMSRATADLTFQSTAIILSSIVTCTVSNSRMLSFSGKPPNISGPGGFVKLGAGTLVVTSDQNTYIGDTVVSNGTLQGGQASNFLPHGPGKGNVFVSAGAMLDMIDNNLIVNGLSGSGTVRCSNLARSFTVGDGNARCTFGGVLTNSGPAILTLVKTGTNAVTLTGTNSFYKGGTIVSNGILIVDNASGYATGTNVVTVTANGTLSGTGSITGPVTVNGTVSPGDNVGTLTTGSQTWNPGGSFGLKLDSTGGSGFLAVNGDINVQSTTSTPFTVKLISLNNSTPGSQWTIATATGTVQNFSADKFTFDGSQFQPPRPASAFAIKLNGSSLQVWILERGTTLSVK